jgi:hypothetical protein
MITLEGIAKQSGVAIAVAAVVDEKLGINAISPALLMDGISSLRNGLRPPDYPEAVLACDKLALGATMRIPGINIVGMAAESDSDVPELPVEIPCVIGVTDLLSSINEGDILIVDGYKGVVHIDPDPQTLIHYQQAEEHRHLRDKVFISSEHIPARTQSGETVYVYALMSDESQLALALSAGADGLMLDLRANREDLGALSGCVLREAAGKPVTFVLEFGCEEILRAAMAYCTPGQVTLASENADLLASQVETALDRVVLEALQLDVDPPRVNLGGFASAGGCDSAGGAVVVDATDVISLPAVSEYTVVIVGQQIGAISELVGAGVRRVAVDPGVVSDAKYAILRIGMEDET